MTSRYASLAAVSSMVMFFRPVFWTLEGRSQESARNGGEVYAALRQVPEKQRARRNPFEKEADAITAGRKLFSARCAGCHGDDARGGKRGPSLKAAPVREATPGELFWILTNGVVRRGMPEWSRLPEPQRWQLVTFLKSLDEPR